MVECYGKGIKNSLLIANTIMFVSGSVVLALGIWTVSDRSFMERLLGINLYIASAVLLIVTGTIVALISLLGFLGAYKEINCMLKSYFMILLALLLLILGIGFLCFVFKAELDDKVQTEMLASMKYYGNDSRVTEAWDSMQSNFGCCGVAMKTIRGFEMWRRESAKFNATIDGPLVPESCCRSREDDATRRQCQGKQPKKEDTYTDGCYEKMKAILIGHAASIGIATACVLAFIAFGLVLSGTLFLILRAKNKAAQTRAEKQALDES